MNTIYVIKLLLYFLFYCREMLINRASTIPASVNSFARATFVSENTNKKTSDFSRTPLNESLQSIPATVSLTSKNICGLYPNSREVFRL
jgi:hypothetical protein